MFRPMVVWHPDAGLQEGHGRLVLAQDGSRLLIPTSDAQPSPLAWVEASECSLVAFYFNHDEHWSAAFRRPEHPRD